MSFNNSRSIDQIIEHLNDDSSVELTAESYPDRPETYQLIQPQGVVLVAYHGSQYGNSAPTQGRAMNILITVLLRNLRASNTAESTLEHVITALAGYKASDWRNALTIKSDRFVKQTDGVWQYDIICSVSTLIETQQNYCYREG